MRLSQKREVYTVLQVFLTLESISHGRRLQDILNTCSKLHNLISFRRERWCRIRSWNSRFCWHRIL